MHRWYCCNILHQKDSKAWEQSNQSHLPSSVQITGLPFLLLLPLAFLLAAVVLKVTSSSAGSQVFRQENSRGTDTLFQNFPRWREQTLNECHELNAARPLKQKHFTSSFYLKHTSNLQVKSKWDNNFFWWWSFLPSFLPSLPESTMKKMSPHHNSQAFVPHTTNCCTD